MTRYHCVSFANLDEGAAFAAAPSTGVTIASGANRVPYGKDDIVNRILNPEATTA